MHEYTMLCIRISAVLTKYELNKKIVNEYILQIILGV